MASAARILVVRLSAMGDIIHGMPAIAALRRARPSVEVGWLIEERWAELLCARGEPRGAVLSESKPLVDRVHAANFSAWRKALLSGASWREMRACLDEVRSSALRCGARPARRRSVGWGGAIKRSQGADRLFATARSSGGHALHSFCGADGKTRSRTGALAGIGAHGRRAALRRSPIPAGRHRRSLG